jgi:hypothetical protein
MAIVIDPVDTFYLSRKETPVIQRGKFSPLLAARSNRSPVNNRHTNQMAHRKIFNEIKILWQDMPGVDKAVWQSFAATYFVTNKYGDVISIGAWQWFCKYNITLGSSGLEYIDLPPATPAPSYSPTFNVFEPLVGIGWFFNVDISIPSGSGILVQRKINRQYQIYKPPLPFDSFRSFTSSDIEPFQIATVAEIPEINKRFFVRLKPCDEFGRSVGWDISDKVSQ